MKKLSLALLLSAATFAGISADQNITPEAQAEEQKHEHEKGQGFRREKTELLVKLNEHANEEQQERISALLKLIAIANPNEFGEINKAIQELCAEINIPAEEVASEAPAEDTSSGN